ncbi:MAG: hypothetical protein C0606_09875 [Hyphomicrobiales bacterium]|nr:MAG: hypothetical protein C0606_09875 [Hyphomicrobiales bacterium]
MTDPTSSLLSRLVPVVFVLLWSTGYIGARMGAPWSEPLSFLTVRFGIVVILMAIVAAVLRAPWPQSRAAAFHAVVVGVLVHGCYLGGVFWGIDRGMPAGVAALIVGLQPLLTAFAAGPVLGEKIGAKEWIGLAIGLVGVSLVLAPKLNVADAGISVGTIVPVLIGTVSITLGTLYQKRFATGIDLRTGAVLQYVGGVSVVGIGALIFENFEITWTTEFIIALAWLVLVLSIGAITLLMMLIRKGAVSRVASLFYLVPVLTALVAWGLFGETLNWIQIAGMAVTTVAVAVVARAPKAG